MTAEEVMLELKTYASSEREKSSAWFFKTGKGEYGESDVFIGVKVPDQRLVAKQFLNLELAEVKTLLESPIHESRLTGLLILTYKYEKVEDDLRAIIYQFYLNNLNRVNNWDLVDASAHKIMGRYLCEHPEIKRTILNKLSESKILWERRVAVVATYWFIRENEFRWTMNLAEKLVDDKEDLIQKAVGWMLREVGKKDIGELRKFLKKYHKTMPRTMLRYAIEKMEKDERMRWMKK